MKPTITWNPQVKLIFSDVDNTIAETYTPIEPIMIPHLEKVLREKIILFMITGGSIQSVYERIVEKIKPSLRQSVLISSCSGAEVWGFDQKGNLQTQPFYSLYNEKLTHEQKKKFREILRQVINEFHLETHPPMAGRDEFRKKTQYNPMAVMYIDRGAQITFQFTNAYNLTEEQAKKLKVPKTNGIYDMRYPFMECTEDLLRQNTIPITARTGGTTAVDFAVEGVSKTTAVHWFLENEQLLEQFKLHSKLLEKNPQLMEIWGDKFSVINGGTDRHICEGLPKEVRAIDFREEPLEELPKGYNIQIWHGEKHLQDGLLEYLKNR